MHFPAEYERILSVPPGLTGPAQVEYAWEGEILARAQLHDRATLYRESILPMKLAIDLRYTERHSVAGDLRAAGRTALLPGRARLAAARRAARRGDEAPYAALASATALVVAVVILAGLLAAEGGPL